jgi:hypothetical protein
VIYLKGNFQQSKIVIEMGEMLLAFRAEIVDALGSRVGHWLTLRLFAIKETQWISLEPDFAVPAQVSGMAGVVIFQSSQVSRAAFFTADAVELE